MSPTVIVSRKTSSPLDAHARAENTSGDTWAATHTTHHTPPPPPDAFYYCVARSVVSQQQEEKEKEKEEQRTKQGNDTKGDGLYHCKPQPLSGQERLLQCLCNAFNTHTVAVVVGVDLHVTPTPSSRDVEFLREFFVACVVQFQVVRDVKHRRDAEQTKEPHRIGYSMSDSHHSGFWPNFGRVPVRYARGGIDRFN